MTDPLMTDNISVTEQMFWNEMGVHPLTFGMEQLWAERSEMMDRRVRKTRDALYSAFVALVAERGYDGFSIQDLIDEADVGRTTFYAHFKAKEDLLQFGFNRWRDELASLPKSTAAERRAFMETLLGHAKSHTGLFTALLGGGGGGLAETEFRSIVEEVVALEVGPGEHRATMIVMLGGALQAAIRQWIDAGVKGAGTEILDAFDKLVSAAKR
ncbi:TetR/AcrR family transcriptional regulator [Aminobacter anthyllidis]|uniref:TetR/AcrR family transcriptional regulator n=1 Tax=Aminobacter anthyllidis TaxID=1035067 RepID=UPI0024551FDE|nr:TetR/AcrR family transcriptional regulator [Aminobacter anthyllidis]MDH4984342.1 TetR/AcrR family transcriptional regulator [Aminobacter anthyllidis]